MAVRPPVCDFGAKAPDFALPDPDGKIFSLAQIAGAKGTLVMFICNHCPYVQAVIDRIQRDATELQALGIGVVAISANDVTDYPQDAPELMKAEAERHGFTFPYLYDETQAVARAYGAECTPDFSATTPTSNCSIAAVWMPRAAQPAIPMPDANFSRRWRRSPKPARVRASRPLRLAARSNGKPHEHLPCTLPRRL